MTKDRLLTIKEASEWATGYIGSRETNFKNDLNWALSENIFHLKNK